MAGAGGSLRAVGAPFLNETTVRATGPGRYHAEIGHEWTLRPQPQGGFVTALALRAMAEELGETD